MKIFLSLEVPSILEEGVLSMLLGSVLCHLGAGTYT